MAVKDEDDSKTAQVAWFVSNCGSRSGREDFVQKLKRFEAASMPPYVAVASSLKCSICLVISTSMFTAIAVNCAASNMEIKQNHV